MRISSSHSTNAVGLIGAVRYSHICEGCVATFGLATTHVLVLLGRAGLGIFFDETSVSSVREDIVRNAGLEACPPLLEHERETTGDGRIVFLYGNRIRFIPTFERQGQAYRPLPGMFGQVGAPAGHMISTPSTANMGPSGRYGMLGRDA